MTEFKQIVGRGTRVHEDTKKFYFTLIDFRGATNHFADPDFDGEPVQIYEPGEGDPDRPARRRAADRGRRRPDPARSPARTRPIVDGEPPDITIPPDGGQRRARSTSTASVPRSSPSASSTSTRTASSSPRACATTPRRPCSKRFASLDDFLKPLERRRAQAGHHRGTGSRRACRSIRSPRKSARTSTPST